MGHSHTDSGKLEIDQNIYAKSKDAAHFSHKTYCYELG